MIATSGRRRPGYKALLAGSVLLAMVMQWAVAGVVLGAGNSDDYLHAEGSKIYDDAGHQVRLTGISWFGFETPEQVYHGLWTAKMETTLDTVADLGFNLLRVPLSVQLVNQWRSGGNASPGSINYSANPDLAGLSSLEILDASIAYCKTIGVKVMLDMHRVVNTQMLDSWYTSEYPVSDFEACWVWLAQHYADDDTVIAMDLFNEPHGVPGDADMVKWDDSTDQNNWRREAARVADLILDVNPRLLIVVEGVEATPKNGYTYQETDSAHYDFTWWGGNLRQVGDLPVELAERQSQVVYSPHDYGPGVYGQSWFHTGFTRQSLEAECWRPNWLYIAEDGIAPVLIGEWGGKLDGGDNERWLGYLAETIVENGLHHTFWCVNPNSGDTGGILLDDWQTVDSAKYGLIKATLWQDDSGRFIGLDHQVDLGTGGTRVGVDTDSGSGSGSGSGSDTGSDTGSGTVTNDTDDGDLLMLLSSTFLATGHADDGGENGAGDGGSGDDNGENGTGDEGDGDDGGGGDSTTTCDGMCNAATPVPPTLNENGGSGNITMYSTTASSGGACNYGSTNVMSYAAMSVDVQPGDGQGQWQGGRICGQCAEVTTYTSQGPKTVVVRILDKCPDGDCGVDLGGSAPGVVMVDGTGRYDGQWRFVSCNGQAGVSDGAPSLDVFQGSNSWWSRVHVRNGDWAIESISWRDAGSSASGTFPYATDPENTFEVPVDTVLQSGMSELVVTIHYTDGTTATVTLTPGQLATAGASYPLE